jgi:hypothetical protein
MSKRAFGVALLVGAIGLFQAGMPAAGAAIRLDRGMAGIELNMSARHVHAVLGEPTRVTQGTWRVGFIARTYAYARRGLSVEFLLGGDRLYAYTITTTSAAERTTRGVGVGSTEFEVRRKIPDVLCERRRRVIRSCKRPREGGVGGTSFVLRQGVVVSVSVFAPVF